VGKGYRFRFHDNPPNLRHVSSQTADAVIRSLRTFRDTLSASRRRTFGRYRAADVAFKLVGTGSVVTDAEQFHALLCNLSSNHPAIGALAAQSSPTTSPILMTRAHMHARAAQLASRVGQSRTAQDAAGAASTKRGINDISKM